MDFRLLEIFEYALILDEAERRKDNRRRIANTSSYGILKLASWFCSSNSTHIRSVCLGHLLPVLSASF